MAYTSSIAPPHEDGAARQAWGVSEYLHWLFLPQSVLEKRGRSQFVIFPDWNPVLLVSDHATIRKIHKATSKVFLGGAGNEFLGPLLGPQSVFLLDGDRHRLARTLIAKSLTPQQIRSRRPALVSAVNALVATATASNSIELNRAFRWLAFQVVAEFALPRMPYRTTRELFRRLERTTGLSGNVVAYSRSLWKPRGRLSIGHYVKRLSGKVDELIYAQVDRAAGRPPESNNLLDILVREQTEHGYDRAFIRDNIVSVLAAGYDTTGAALSWLAFWLAQATPERVRELAREGDRPENDRPLRRAFILESLRLAPPIEILPRRICPSGHDEARSILGDAAGPLIAGEGLVAPCPYMAHRDPQVYPEPDTFHAERFLTRSYGLHEFLPFGGGTRLCSGHLLGTAMLETLLEVILREGKTFRIDRPRRFRPVRKGVSLWPSYALRAQLAPIQRVDAGGSPEAPRRCPYGHGTGS
jgi:cytochrome P450